MFLRSILHRRRHFSAQPPAEQNQPRRNVGAHSDCIGRVEQLEERCLLSAAIVKDIATATSGLVASNLTDVNGTVFFNACGDTLFSASDPSYGVELWNPPAVDAPAWHSHGRIERTGIIDRAVALEERFPPETRPPFGSKRHDNERSDRSELDEPEHLSKRRRGSRPADSSRTSGTALVVLADAVHADSLPRIVTPVADAQITSDLSDLRASAIESGLGADFLEDIVSAL